MSPKSNEDSETVKELQTALAGMAVKAHTTATRTTDTALLKPRRRLLDSKKPARVAIPEEIIR
jgi:hypothetical protein